MRKFFITLLICIAVAFVSFAGIAVFSFMHTYPNAEAEMSQLETGEDVQEDDMELTNFDGEFGDKADQFLSLLEGFFNDDSDTTESNATGTVSDNNVAGYPVRVEEFTMNADNYSADRFGGWASVGGGCDVRDSVLSRDLTDKMQNGCDMRAGSLVDPYTGSDVYWETGNRAVDIDHVVARSNAWSAGAKDWTDAQLQEFSNDESNLLATDAGVNRWKSDRLPADVLANGGFTAEGKCLYIDIYASTVSKYDLAVPQADVTAMNTEWADNGCIN